MDSFGFIEIENKEYPKVIMGEDSFTGWFGKDPFESERDRAKSYTKTLKMAYRQGVRGFSISPQKTLVKALKNFKKDHPEIICISNHHWQTHYYSEEKLLWSSKNLKKLSRTISSKFPKFNKCKWGVSSGERFRLDEIRRFRLDEKEYISQLKNFKFCDFCLIGNLGKSSLILLRREDILEKEIVLAREEGMTPLGMCEASFALPLIEKLDVAGNWTWVNKEFACPSLESVTKIIKSSKKPITAYKIFGGGQGNFDLRGSLEFLSKLKMIKSIVVGVENETQAEETFQKIKQLNIFS
jgi:hypothetical protein